jgi:predicted Zn-dependent peptidase
MEYFKRTFHAACNTAISVAGNIRHSEVQALAERHFSEALAEAARRALPP